MKTNSIFNEKMRALVDHLALLLSLKACLHIHDTVLIPDITTADPTMDEIWLQIDKPHGETTKGSAE